MRETNRIVINTGPIIALIAASGDLEILRQLYDQVLVPNEVAQEVLAGGDLGFGISQFTEASWLCRQSTDLVISPFLQNILDRGEASVIQLALSENIGMVCIDETLGRRAARLNGLQLTGSVGILLRAKLEGHLVSVKTALERMRMHGIWLSEKVMHVALREAGEL